VTDLITTIDRKLSEFIERAETRSDTTFRPVFEADEQLWRDCLSQRGLGDGYRERIGVVMGAGSGAIVTCSTR